jgi:hypothetical protein
MVSPHTPSEALTASRDLLALLAEIDESRPALAVATPERQRLAFTIWIARARAAESILGGTWARQQVTRVAETLHRLSRLWWPGNIAALDPRSTPGTAWPGAVAATWRDVAIRCSARLERAEVWADDAARLPPPHDAAELFATTLDLLGSFGGPLGVTVPLDRSPALMADAGRRIPALVRAAAALRWLRGTAPADAWGLAIGRARGLARALGVHAGDLAGLLAPSLVPLKGWAVHCGRDPALERVLGQIPRANAPDTALLAWLMTAFDALDTPALARQCTHLTQRLLGMQPHFADRRHRRRFDQLRHQLAPHAISVVTPTKRAGTDPRRSDPRIAELRAQLMGRRVLFATNRSAPEIEALLAEHLGVRCEAVVSASSPRRRQSLHARILRGSYDIVLVAHGFTGHADTEQLGAACRQVAVPFCMVDKGRLARIVDALWIHRHHPRLAAPVATPDSAA